MGWPQAILGGIAYGTVLGALVYGFWAAATAGHVGKFGIIVALYLFAMGLSIPPMIESSERSRIKKGQARDIREALRGR